MTATPGHGTFKAGRMRQIYLALAAVGAGAFVYGLLIGDNIRAWQALLVNFLFFTGLAHAGVALSAILQTTSALMGVQLLL